MNKRNKEILSALERDKKPVLQFELDAARGALEACGAEQERLGKLLGEAMTQSSETWHDNAPADVINELSRVNVAAAGEASALIENAQVFEWPINQLEITLGSLALIEYVQPPLDQELLLMTGTPCEIGDDILDFMPRGKEVEISTIGSQTGKALLGKEVGQSVRYTVSNGRSFELKILEILSAQRH